MHARCKTERACNGTFEPANKVLSVTGKPLARREFSISTMNPMEQTATNPMRPPFQNIDVNILV